METTIRNAIVAGACFVGVCIFMLALPMFNDLVQSFWPHAIALVVALALYAMTLIAHLNGFRALGEKHGLRLLNISALLLMGWFAVFELMVILVLIMDWKFGPGLAVNIVNGLIGLAVTFGILPALLFIVSLARAYRQFGFLALVTASVPAVAVIFMWRPWIPIFVVCISMYFLHHVGTKGPLPVRSKVVGGL